MTPATQDREQAKSDDSAADTKTGVEHHVTNACPHCGHVEIETVTAHVDGRGHGQTLAIRECQDCGTLWGDPREFYGVTER